MPALPDFIELLTAITSIFLVLTTLLALALAHFYRGKKRGKSTPFELHDVILLPSFVFVFYCLTRLNTARAITGPIIAIVAILSIVGFVIVFKSLTKTTRQLAAANLSKVEGQIEALAAGPVIRSSLLDSQILKARMAIIKAKGEGNDAQAHKPATYAATSGLLFGTFHWIYLTMHGMTVAPLDLLPTVLLNTATSYSFWKIMAGKKI